MTHILIIDNDHFGRMLLADALLSSDPGMTVATAAHGCQSVDRYRERHPDLVIAEIARQEAEGIDTISNLRELDRELPVVLTSRGLPITVPEPSETALRAAPMCDLLSVVRTCLKHPVAATRQNSAVN